MREIEIKASVGDKQSLLGRMVAQGMQVSEPVIQRDRVFGLLDMKGGGADSAPWLRIRTETSGNQTKHLFTLKKSVTNQMDSIEHETEVVGEGELERIILHLGFMPYSDTMKARQKAQVGGIELCVDTIDGLGDFIEAEKLTSEDADYDAVAEELWKLLESLGVTREDHVTDGYDVLTRKRDHLDD
jgi:adenylate cyclase class 2